MHTKSKIAEEIVELSAIKFAFCHYLASHRAITDIENTITIQQNKVIITNSIARLKKLLNQPGSNNTIYKGILKVKPYQYSEAETRAIVHFNSDTRYKITE